MAFVTENTPATSGLRLHAIRVLIAEDDVPLARFLQSVLQNEGYAVDLAYDGEAAVQALARDTYKLLVVGLELDLPRQDGVALLRQVRSIASGLPVLAITAQNRPEDRIVALDGGADDCLVKPFSFQELTARARAILRRSQLTAPRNLIQVGDLRLSREELRVERAGRKLDLTAKEFALLEYLMDNARYPVTRAMIMEHVWKGRYDGQSNLVDVYMKYVRDKVDADFPKKLIHTIRGVGYAVSDN